MMATMAAIVLAYRMQAAKRVVAAVAALLLLGGHSNEGQEEVDMT